MRTTESILAVISNELAIKGINIMEFMSCFPEMLIFVDEKDMLKAYQVLHLLRHPES